MSLNGQFWAIGDKFKQTGSYSPCIWNVSGGKLIESKKFVGHNCPIIDVAFSPDGELIATTSSDQALRLWDVQSVFSPYTEAYEMVSPGDPIIQIAFSPSGRYLAVSANSGIEILEIWSDPPRVSLVKNIKHGIIWLRNSQILVFSLDESQLAFTGENYTIRIISFFALLRRSPWRTKILLKGHTAIIRDVAFSPDGKLLASVSDDITMRLWDSKTGKEIWKKPQEMSQDSRVMFRPSSDASSTANSTVPTSESDRES